MGKRWLGFLAVIFLASALVPVANAQKDIDVYGWGVHYFVATGTQRSAHFGLSPAYNGTNLVPFEGCGNILARPSKGAGVVEAVGIIENTNLIEVFLDEFRTPTYTLPITNGIGANITIDGSEDHEGKPTHPKAFARVAAYATAHIEVDGYNFTEDDKEPKQFWASFYVTNTGFRDNESKAILTKSGAPYAPNATDVVQEPDDWEMHMRLEAPGSKRATTLNYRSRGDSGVPPPPHPAVPNLYGDLITYQEEHKDSFTFNSMAPGGKAELRISATSRAPPGQTSLRFVVISPGGWELANVTMEPSALGSTPPKQLNLALNQFGVYTIQVSGKAVLAQYQVTGRVVPPPKMDFNFWWENVSFERQAVKDISGCKDRLLNELMSAVMQGAGRDRPPVMNLEVVAVASVVSIVGVLFLVKLVSDAVITGQFKSAFRRR